MKTDTQLQRDVVDELMWEPSINESEIAVAAKGGVVTLAGNVSSYAQKFAAERAAERVIGVRAIADTLNVRLPGEWRRGDTEIAHAAVNALAWDSEVPDGKITVKVDNGFIVLTGQVEWNYQRAAAERALRNLRGVKGVFNEVSVTPRLSTKEVKSRIESALRRSAELDASGITVQASDGKVTLKGRVRTWTEREDAERAAWGAPGVKEVADKLVVAP